MLLHRLRIWPNINSTLVQCILFVVIHLPAFSLQHKALTQCWLNAGSSSVTSGSTLNQNWVNSCFLLLVSRFQYSQPHDQQEIICSIIKLSVAVWMRDIVRHGCINPGDSHHSGSWTANYVCGTIPDTCSVCCCAKPKGRYCLLAFQSCVVKGQKLHTKV